MKGLILISDGYKNYTSSGDITVILSCIVFLILMQISYIPKYKATKYFKRIIVCLLLTTAVHMMFYITMSSNELLNIIPSIVVRSMSILKNIGIYCILLLYSHYIMEPLHVTPVAAKRNAIFFQSIAFIFTMYEIISLILNLGLRFEYKNGNIKIIEGHDIHHICAIVFVVSITIFMLYYRHRIFKQILFGIVFSCIVSSIVVLVQLIGHLSSCTMVTFLFPTYTLLYLIHSNPYDIEVGTLNEDAFIKEIKAIKNNDELIILQIYMPEIEKSAVKESIVTHKDIYGILNKYFKITRWFKFSKGSIVLTAPVNKNKNYLELSKAFTEEINKFFILSNTEYKMIITTNNSRINPTEYKRMFKYFGSKIAEYESYIIFEDKLDEYFRYREIVHELNDINTKEDLNDERVIIYCQPIFNIRTQRYDTAETLMRLKVNDKIIMPNEFIPIAEKKGLLYTLGLIILNKACSNVKNMLDSGYYLSRVSVNFSVSDFRHKDFCDRICNTIEWYNISYRCIAIEITETQSDNDFIILRDKMKQLSDKGVKFYLDDFGTGYSNYERIAELPFDVIKFDRSLVIASGKGNRTKNMVQDMASIFKGLDYLVLYEGIETEEDTERCKEMYGEYMQGYYYSEPIPIEQLTKFLSKRDNGKYSRVEQ